MPRLHLETVLKKEGPLEIYGDNNPLLIDDDFYNPINPSNFTYQGAL